jgi:hypothetical protein
MSASATKETLVFLTSAFVTKEPTFPYIPLPLDPHVIARSASDEAISSPSTALVIRGAAGDAAISQRRSPA